ncbi:hypothetical protein IT570_02530 [Candidatus Sumerlaeota bacterium]|nr:hypothetical protein [Candidatus Sumerlaeota bacterium]
MGKDLRSAVHHYFKEFDFSVAEAIFTELQKPGGLPRLLKKLGLPDDGDSAAHYAVLIQYFRRKGTSEFLQLVGVQKLDFHIQPTSGQLNAGDTGTDRQKALFGNRSGVVPLILRGESARQTRDDRATHPGAHTSNSSTATPKLPDLPPHTPAPVQPIKVTPPMGIPRAASPYDNVDDNGFPKGPLIGAPSPAPESVPQGALAFDPSKPHDPTGVWPEVERRSGRERRRTPDRRKALEVTFKNRRFGKDRRKASKDRRKNWPPEGFRP